MDTLSGPGAQSAVGSLSGVGTLSAAGSLVEVGTPSAAGSLSGVGTQSWVGTPSEVGSLAEAGTLSGPKYTLPAVGSLVGLCTLSAAAGGSLAGFGTVVRSHQPLS